MIIALKVVVSVLMVSYVLVMFGLLLLNAKHPELTDVPLRQWRSWLRSQRAVGEYGLWQIHSQSEFGTACERFHPGEPCLPGQNHPEVGHG